MQAMIVHTTAMLLVLANAQSLPQTPKGNSESTQLILAQAANVRSAEGTSGPPNNDANGGRRPPQSQSPNRGQNPSSPPAQSPRINTEYYHQKFQESVKNLDNTLQEIIEERQRDREIAEEREREMERRDARNRERERERNYQEVLDQSPDLGQPAAIQPLPVRVPLPTDLGNTLTDLYNSRSLLGSNAAETIQGLSAGRRTDTELYELAWQLQKTTDNWLVGELNNNMREDRPTSWLENKDLPGVFDTLMNARKKISNRVDGIIQDGREWLSRFSLTHQIERRFGKPYSELSLEERIEAFSAEWIFPWKANSLNDTAISPAIDEATR